jgi:hypothetical protein
MTLEEYRQDLIEEIKLSAEYSKTFPEKEFVTMLFDKLNQVEEVLDPIECYFENYGKNRRKIGFDGYAFDDADNSISLLICDYSNENEMTNLTLTMVENLINKMRYFVLDVINQRLLDSIDIAEPAHGFGADLKRYYQNNEITKFKFYILTDRKISDTARTLTNDPILGVESQNHIWDIERFYNADNASKGKENIQIDFSEFQMNGLQCIKASQFEDDNYTAYLSVIPGDILASIYLKYGSKLLEGNVRSFLSIRGKVNKGIRTTILKEPENFFTYNNGIAVTATNAKFMDDSSGLRLLKLDDMQIINGGQTTASLASSVIKEHADLSKVFVPMKLTVIDQDKADELIPFISRYANSQNKVSEADFFSNHPFHIRIEQLSRKILAPPVDGNQYQTAWYYERARGQYQQEQMKLSPSERKKFKIKHPKNQLITKTQLAKYVNTFVRKPHVVSWGAQRNMRDFASSIDAHWNKNNAVFNDHYFKKVVALSILYRSSEKIVQTADWYEQGYRANIVTYSLAKIFNDIASKHPNKSLDFDFIWNNQRLSDALATEIKSLGKVALDFITSSNRPILNVTEWCKKAECWNQFERIEYVYSNRFIDELVNKQSQKEKETNAVKDQRISTNVSLEIQVVNLGSQYWSKMLELAMHRNLLNPKERELLTLASSMEKTGRVPSSRQAKLILQIRDKLLDEGIKVIG